MLSVVLEDIVDWLLVSLVVPSIAAIHGGCDTRTTTTKIQTSIMSDAIIWMMGLWSAGHMPDCVHPHPPIRTTQKK